MNRSTAALIIAVLFHLLILALFTILGMIAPEPKPKEAQQQERIRISLKEQPQTSRQALVKNSEPQVDTPLPMPKGRQLESIPQEAFKKVPPPPYETPKPEIKPAPAAPKPPKQRPLPVPDEHIEVPKTITLPPQPKEPEPVAPTPAEKVPEDSSKLYSQLSKQYTTVSQKAPEEISPENRSRITENLKDAYGDTFGQLSQGEQKFILDNQEIMRRITQEVLNRVAAANIPDNFRVTDYNVVEFYLYPNGDISDIQFIRRSGFYMLDDTTVETIQYAYSRYPKPAEKTLIRYKVGYFLQGY